MAWIALTETLIASRLSGAELTALKSAALGAGQTGDQILADAISATVREVRGYVAANKNNTLGDGETIPDELEHAALALLRHRLGSRLPGVKLFNDEARKAEYDDAVTLLRDVAAGKFGIVPPVTEAAAQAAGGGTQLINSRSRKATRETMAGL